MSKIAMMYQTIVVVMMFSILSTAIFPIIAQGNTDILSLITDDRCEIACWLGIEPGKTTSQQLEVILDGNGLVYGSETFSMNAQQSFYTIRWTDENANILFPYARDFGRTVILSYDGVVRSIRTSIRSLPLSVLVDVINTIPDDIVRSPGVTTIVYRELGMVIAVSDQDNETRHIILATQRNLDIQLLENEFAVSIHPCVEPAILCNLETKANNGENADIRNLFTDDNCEMACWLGIEPDITTMEEVANILVSNEITYSTNRDPFDGTLISYTIYWIDNDATLFPLASEFASTIILPNIDGVVDSVATDIDKIPLSVILASFTSPPDGITDYFGDFAISYLDLGVAFVMKEEKGEYFAVYFALATPTSLQANTLSPFTPDIRPCVEPASLCTILTK